MRADMRCKLSGKGHCMHQCVIITALQTREADLQTAVYKQLASCGQVIHSAKVLQKFRIEMRSDP